MSKHTIDWRPVSEQPDDKKHVVFTMVLVKGWCRPAYALWRAFNSSWDISDDPCFDKSDVEITHWLAIPQQSLDQNKTFAWKVVSKQPNGKLVSAFLLPNGRESVKYKLNTWIRPTGKLNDFLCVFATRKAARTFIKECKDICNDNLQVHKCEVENPRKKVSGWRIGRASNRMNDASPWTFDAESNWPKHTLFVDAVKLLRKDH